MENKSEQYMTIKQLTEYLCVKQSWVRLRLFKKDIPHIKICGLVRFRKEEIDNWLCKSKVEVNEISDS